MYYISKGAESTLAHSNGVAGEVTVDGRRLETLTIAPRAEDRPTIVMLHEGGGAPSQCGRIFRSESRIGRGCGVFVYSRYGYGGSDRLEGKRPVEYMHHEAEVVLPALLKEVGIKRPILLGHSDGGSIALTGCRHISGFASRLDLGGASRICRRLVGREHRQGQDLIPDHGPSKEAGALSPGRRCHVLGLERYLAGPAFSLLEH